MPRVEQRQHRATRTAFRNDFDDRHRAGLGLDSAPLTNENPVCLRTHPEKVVLRRGREGASVQASRSRLGFVLPAPEMP